MPVEAANAAQRDYWNLKAGPVWVARQELLDAQIGPLGSRTLAALAPQPGERVLDVGCGCGASTLELARSVGPEGLAVGLDLSAPMLTHARTSRGGTGPGAPRFLRADAQEPPFGPGFFDALTSRFGVMFFADPERAFRSLAGALRPGGRVAFLCWQGPERNPWMTLPARAVADRVALPEPPPPGAPGPFSLADPERLRGLLVAAGLVEVELRDEQGDLAVGGGGVEEAVALAMDVGPVGAALREARGSETLLQEVAGRLRAAFASHRDADGSVRMPGAAWIATGRRG